MRTPILLVLAFLLAQPLSASANDPPKPEPRTFLIAAEGTGVRVQETLPDGVDCTLARYTPGTHPPPDWTAVMEYGWSHGDAEESWVECWPDGDLFKADCDETPEECVDCNDDGVPECAGYCVTFGRFEVVEECVPIPAGEDEHEYDWCGCSDCLEVTVPYVDPCQDMPDGDDDDDDGHHGSTGTTSDGAGGCTCRIDARPGTALVAAALSMIGLGWACLEGARRRD